MNAAQYSKTSLMTAPHSKPVTNSKNKRKSRWKLKFHHQALPPEYLDHYEASLHPQRDISKIPAPTAITSTSDNKSISSPPIDGFDQSKFSSCFPTVRYKDLPFMGEMTLDNARPRRGRKPKKADICHLIYKNYGTTVVDEPLNLCLRDLQYRNVAESSSPEDHSALREKREKLSGAKKRPYNFRILDRNLCNPKSRKSIARENLEKTFKERGFLIQTQQLESEQGATYCKFRQLRKFTRYLFRSWKHHLPGDMAHTSNHQR